MALFFLPQPDALKGEGAMAALIDAIHKLKA
jgi:hypothetical protein